MNKIYIILSMVMLSTPCLAKTKFYGELNAAYENAISAEIASRDEFALTSILGVKGAREVKKDVSFIYNLSWGLSTDNVEENFIGQATSSGFYNRNQVIGIASPSGAAIIGRFDTPFKTLGRKADLFWDSQIGQNRNITNAQDWDLRADKIIVLQSPKKKGFQGSVAYSPDISGTSKVTDNASAVSLNGFYDKGKFRLGAAYERHNLDQSSANAQALRLSAIHKNGAWQSVAFYQNENNDFAQTAKPDAVVLGVGLAMKKAKGTYKAQVYTRDEDRDNGRSNLFAVGYDHKFSKQLDFYTQFAKISNPANLNSNAGSNNTIDGISVGVKYTF